MGNPEGVHCVYLRSRPHPPLPLRFQCSPLPTTTDFTTCQSVALKGKLGELGCVPWITVQQPGVKGPLSAGLTFSMLSGLASTSRCRSGGDNIRNVDAEEYSKHWGKKTKLCWRDSQITGALPHAHTNSQPTAENNQPTTKLPYIK